MDRFKKLVSGEISWSTSIREYVKEREKTGECIYCGDKKDLTLDRSIDLCPKCDLGAKCPEKEKLTVYCLEGSFCKK